RRKGSDRWAGAHWPRESGQCDSVCGWSVDSCSRISRRETLGRFRLEQNNVDSAAVLLYVLSPKADGEIVLGPHVWPLSFTSRFVRTCAFHALFELSLMDPGRLELRTSAGYFVSIGLAGASLSGFLVHGFGGT